eukprot:5710862-Prymnesium_polylepis.1
MLRLRPPLERCSESSASPHIRHDTVRLGHNTVPPTSWQWVHIQSFDSLAVSRSVLPCHGVGWGGASASDSLDRTTCGFADTTAARSA